MKKRKENFFKREYRLSWKYIRESEKFIYIGIGIFAFFTLVGLLFPIFFVDVILEFMKKLLEQTSEMGSFELMRFILLNNLQSSLFSIVFGFVFGIFPVISSLVNGYMLGFVSAAVISEESVLSLWRLLPHGIFELPAIFISIGMGMKFGTFVFRKKKWESFKEYFWNSLRVFIFVVMPLLIIAAVIEGWLILYIG